MLLIHSRENNGDFAKIFVKISPFFNFVFMIFFIFIIPVFFILLHICILCIIILTAINSDGYMYLTLRNNFTALNSMLQLPTINKYVKNAIESNINIYKKRYFKITNKLATNNKKIGDETKKISFSRRRLLSRNLNFQI